MAKIWTDAQWMGYLLAVASTSAVLLMRWAVDPYLGDTAPYILFFVPIGLAAYVGGWGPGLLALVLSAFAGTMRFLPPRGTLLLSMSEDRILLVLFLLTGLLAVWLATWARAVQGEERRQARQFRQTLDSIRDAYLLLDFNWNVLDINREARRVLERSSSELLGKDLWSIFPGLWNEQDGETMRQGMVERVSARFEQFYPLLGKWLEMSLYPCEEGLVVFFRDVTQRKHSDASLRLLSDISTRLLMAKHPDAILRGIFDEVADHLHLDVYCNYLVAPDGGELRLNACRGLDESILLATWSGESGQRLCGNATCMQVCLDGRDLSPNPHPNADMGRVLGVRACVCQPLLGSGFRGTIAFGSRDRDGFTEEEMGLIRSVADQVSMALAKQQLALELERRAAALQEANKAKDHFLATLSHELRTPLTPVLAGVSILQVDGRLNSDARQSLDIIRRNVELEARLIDDLLDITRISRGKVELYKRPVSFCEVLLEAVDVCQPDIEARRLHFDLGVEPAASCWVEADPARLQQVFWNLIKNAVKFTPPGGRIGVRAWQEDDQVVAFVQDSGKGIAPEALDRIFTAFEQAELSTTRQFGGLGLGLAISRALVEMHGGAIEAFSEGEGKGSTFRVRLPSIPAPTAAAAPSAPACAQAAATNRRLHVLLVEDHGDTARILARILTRRGYRVETVGDVAAALEQVGRQHFDLLVSDLGLPDRSGLDLIRELRARGQMFPAIALSGYGQEEDVKRSHEAGFNVHMIKPINFEQFYKTIAEVTA